MKTFLLTTALIMTGIFSSTAQQGISVGDEVPMFKATADDGTTWDIKNHLGKDFLVVYFYPGALTGGCTKQACAYRDRQQELDQADVTVVGISGDRVENLKLFKKAENLNFTLLSDEKGEISKAFGVPVGAGGNLKKVVEGTEYEISRDLSAKRWTFVVDRDGRIIYKNEAVDPEKDTEQVLNFIKLQSQK